MTKYYPVCFTRETNEAHFEEGLSCFTSERALHKGRDLQKDTNQRIMYTGVIVQYDPAHKNLGSVVRAALEEHFLSKRQEDFIEQD